LINKAFSEIEAYKSSDPALYEKLHKRIDIESIFIRYLQIELYSGQYSPGTLYGMKIQFRADCEKYGITNYEEFVELPDSLWPRWGIA
ncbi:MAG: hypothetical protein LBL66_02005, partial [Clostridiales bacterium]|jgi:hypothetical protein|nr:hypothetical protein [Clostridiales bacterium]